MVRVIYSPKFPRSRSSYSIIPVKGRQKLDPNRLLVLGMKSLFGSTACHPKPGSRNPATWVCRKKNCTRSFLERNLFNKTPIPFVLSFVGFSLGPWAAGIRFWVWESPSRLLSIVLSDRDPARRELKEENQILLDFIGNKRQQPSFFSPHFVYRFLSKVRSVAANGSWHFFSFFGTNSNRSKLLDPSGAMHGRDFKFINFSLI